MYVYKILFGHDILKIFNLCLCYIVMLCYVMLYFALIDITVPTGTTKLHWYGDKIDNRYSCWLNYP